MHKVTYAAIALLAATALAVFAFPSKRTFTDIDDFRAWAGARKLIVWPPAPASSAHVSNDPAVRTKLDGDESEVTRRSLVTVSGSVDELPAGVEHRIWGKVVAYGNPELLRKLDESR